MSTAAPESSASSLKVPSPWLIQRVRAQRGNVYVGIAVVVEITDGEAHTVPDPAQSRGRRHIGEGVVRLLVIQAAVRRRRTSVGPMRAAVDKVDIEAAVVVVVD